MDKNNVRRRKRVKGGIKMCVVYDIKERKINTPMKTVTGKHDSRPTTDSNKFWHDNIEDIVELETNYTSADDFKNKFKKR